MAIKKTKEELIEQAEENYKRYWGNDRILKSQRKIADKSIKQIELQLRKYYLAASKKCIADFEAVYEKILNTQAAGKEITPADLYKLDKYWIAQANMREELLKLGDRQILLLSKSFEANWFDFYYSTVIPSIKDSPYHNVDKGAVKQMINRIWCADGKSWSDRVWKNTESLTEMLNNELINCVATGKKTTELKNLLQERFAVSYGRADALVRTEIAHIQTEAAKQRYEDYGIEEVEIWADEDERRCEVCGEHHQKRYPMGAFVPIPAHPKCRCCIVPVVD
jgi:SPP1 gp7 family putative phage head morphogenesis protein